MNKKTTQETNWAGGFGDRYTYRSPTNITWVDDLYKEIYGIGIDELYNDFFEGLDRSIKVLEVGSNVGTQLIYFQEKGFKKLYGIEINPKTVEMAKSLVRGINFIQGSALDIPFKDGYFDLVFTAGVLIHISPENIEKALKEIYRCSQKYIFGLEYYNERYIEIPYRGERNMLWKANFPKLYLNFFKNLKIVKEKKLKYLTNGNVDVIYLLEKRYGKN